MGFTPFKFTKSWRSAKDFPTFESEEAQVREDMQLLHDEAASGINKLINEIIAENIPFSPTAAIDSTNIQNALENVQRQIALTAMGTLPDNSIEASKLKDGVITEQKLEDGAITNAKLAAEVVTADKLAKDSVYTDALQDGSVTRAKMASGVYADKADLSNGKVKASQLSRSLVAVTGSRVLATSDAGCELLTSGSSAITLTLPKNSDDSIPVDTEIVICRGGQGTVTLSAASGVTLNYSSDNALLSSVYSFVSLKKISANSWVAASTTPAKVIVGTDLLADASVTEVKLKDKAVTQAKLASDALPILFTNKSVSTSSWSKSNTYTDFAYRAFVSLSGISDRYFVDVVLSAEDAASGIYAAEVTVSGAGVYIYASEVPSSALTIPTILCIPVPES